MCGIAGILSPDRRSAIVGLTEALFHRGPDGNGYFEDDHVALGQRRLSIIDLEGGRQPMSNETGRIHLVCNGEIYNSPTLRRELAARGHVFKTHCDVEVILHLYEEHGKDCVKHLRGMFAFALWDQDRRMLLLARDHMGQKPMHYVDNGRELIFASEVGAILQAGMIRPEIDLQGLWHYISLRFLPQRLTLFKGIQKLPAAHILVWQDGRSTVERYWDIAFAPKLRKDEREIEEELNALLLETVDLHLLSDVPVGAFLSGGIDSSLMASMMATLGRGQVPTFSIGMREQSFDELPFARMVTQRYADRMVPHERVVRADIVRLVPAMIRAMGEPADPFGVGVYLVAQLAAEHVKVVIGGDGGDENFAGYDRHAGQRLIDYYCLMPEWLRRTVMPRLIERIPNTFNYKSLAQKAMWANHMSFFTHGRRYAESMSFLRFGQEAKGQLFTAAARDAIEDRDSAEQLLCYFDATNADELVDKMLYAELMTRMPDHNLVVNDRMCMAHSLECRSPLIDHKVVEYAATLPGDVKLHGKQLKYILRKLAGRYLPSELTRRQKQGFGFPLGMWMRGELKGFVENLFRQSRFVELGLFDPAYMERLRDEHVSGRFEHSFRLWILINLELWYRLHFEGQTVETSQGLIEELMAA